MTEIKTITLCKETAELFDCKKKLDECFNTLGKVHETLLGYDKAFEESLGKAYIAMNDVNTSSSRADRQQLQSNLTTYKRFATTFLLWLFCFYTIPIPFLFLLSLRLW